MRRPLPLLVVGLVLVPAFPAARALAAPPRQDAAEPADGEEKPDEQKPKWDVNAPPGEPLVVPVDTDEGTWLSLDVRPDGRAIVFDLLGDLYTLPIEGGAATRISSGIAWDMHPRFSPDGARIAFTSDEGGGDNLWVMDADGSGRRQVSHESFRLVTQPAWTPDGAFVAGRKHFTSRRSAGAGEIWLWHESGGDGVQMTVKPSEQKDVGEPAFSPDGRFLYYSLDATPGGSFEYNKDPNAQIYAIRRLDRVTGDDVALVTGPGGAARPTPSPDGRSLAFIRRVRGDTVLFLFDLASGAARPVQGGLERDMQETWAIHGVYPAMAFTPDSRSLVLWSAGKFLRVDLETGAATPIPFRVQDEREIRAALRFPIAVAPETFHVRVLQGVRVAPQGDRVCYQALGRIWIKDLPDGAPRRLTTQDERCEAHPSWSRDGTRIVYVDFDDEDLCAVRVAPAGGDPVESGERITQRPGHYVDPVFTPDGAQVVFSKVGGGGIVSPLWSQDPGVYRVPAGGGEMTKITKRGGRPQFGADPARVYLTATEPQGENDRALLLSIDLDGSDERVHVTSDNAVEYALSPDGAWLAFVERWNAYVLPFVATGREVQVGPKSKALPLRRLSRDAGENLHFSGDSSAVHWSLGPELFTRPLAESFAFVEGAPDELPEPPERGVDVSFDHPTDVPDHAGIVLQGARIVTLRGDEVIENGTIVVQGNRIAAIGPSDSVDVAIANDTRVVDVAGKTIVPGFIDVHAHGAQAVNGFVPRHNWQHHANLAFGVTTIHDPSHDTNAIFSVAELARAGKILSPRTFSTGTILYGASGNFKAEVDSLDDARSHLRRLQAVGAFSVKSYNQPRRDQRQQVIAAARELGMMVVPEGGSTFQHNLTMVVDGHTGVEHSLPVERIYRDVQQLWGPSGVGYTPTLVVGYGGLWGEEYWYSHMDVWAHEHLQRFVPRFVLDPRSRRREIAPEEEYNTDTSAGICRALLDAGARVQLGAHGQLAGLGAHWELWLIAKGGLTPLEALRAASLDGAVYLGLDGDLGSLEPGKLADLVVLDENPLEDVRNTDSVSLVMLNGRLFDASDLSPAFGEKGEAPRYFWQAMQNGLPAQQLGGQCAGCGGN